MQESNEEYSDKWWEPLIPKCPECKSKRVTRLNLFKNTFLKGEAEIEKYRCKKCGCEFWL